MAEAGWAVEKVYKEREAARQAGHTFEGRYLVPTISCGYLFGCIGKGMYV